MSIAPLTNLPTYRPPSGAVSSGSGIPEGGVTRADFNDPAGLGNVRAGARWRDDGDARLGVVLSNTTSFRVRWKMILHSAQGNTRAVWSRRSTGGWGFVLSSGEGTAIIYHSSSTQVLVMEDFFVPEEYGEAHEYEVAVDADTVTVSKDGAQVATTTHAQSVTKPLTYIGASNVAWESADYTLWDFEYIDEDTPANSATFKLDGDFSNSYPGSTVADPTLVEEDEITFETVLSNTPAAPLLAAPLTGLMRAHVNDLAGLASVKLGSRFRENTLTDWYSVSLTATTSFRIKWKMAAHFSPSATRQVWGRRVAGGYSFLYSSSVVSIFESTGNSVLTGIPQFIPFDGTAHEYEVAIDGSSCTVWMDGVQIDTGSHSRPVAKAFDRIGAATSTWESGDYTLWDFEYFDEDAPTRNAFYALGGSLLNTYPGSTTGDLTENGFIRPVRVLGNSGGAPVLAKRSYLHFVQGVTGSKTGAGDYHIEYSDVRLDETGSAAASSYPFNAPVDGVAVVKTGFSLAPNSDGLDNANFVVRVGSTNHDVALFDVGEVPERVSIYGAGVFAVSAGEDIRVRITGIATATTFDIFDQYVFIDFRPS